MVSGGSSATTATKPATQSKPSTNTSAGSTTSSKPAASNKKTSNVNDIKPSSPSSTKSSESIKVELKKKSWLFELADNYLPNIQKEAWKKETGDITIIPGFKINISISGGWTTKYASPLSLSMSKSEIGFDLTQKISSSMEFSLGLSFSKTGVYLNMAVAVIHQIVNKYYYCALQTSFYLNYLYIAAITTLCIVQPQYTPVVGAAVSGASPTVAVTALSYIVPALIV